MLNCSRNQISSLPELNEKLETIMFHDNEIYNVINTNDVQIVRSKIEVLRKFKHLYYSLNFKSQFRKWLWERVREPKIMSSYSPYALMKMLDEKITFEPDSVFDIDIIYPIMVEWTN
jgi:hypothetical protein